MSERTSKREREKEGGNEERSFDEDEERKEGRNETEERSDWATTILSPA